MNVLIDTRNPIEYLRLRRVAEARTGAQVYRAPLIGRRRLERHYDVIVSARSDAENLATAERWRNNWGLTFLILIMDSEDSRFEAMNCHVFDYLTRPLDEECFVRALRDAETYFAGGARRRTTH